MKKSDVRVGMKVVPFKKSVGFYDGIVLVANAKNEFSKSPIWNFAKENKRPYLYVKQVESEEGIEYFHLGIERGKRGGADFFLVGDFRPYVPKKASK